VISLKAIKVTYAKHTFNEITIENVAFILKEYHHCLLPEAVSYETLIFNKNSK